MLCDGPEDCAGEACCLGITVGATCADAGASCGDDTPDTACNLDEDCPDGQSCQPHALVGWILICQ
jgi:hypothetical protein